MTRKDYEAIAAILADAATAKDPRLIIGYDLAEYFKTDNPRFNRVTFLSAAQIGGY